MMGQMTIVTCFSALNAISPSNLGLGSDVPENNRLIIIGIQTTRKTEKEPESGVDRGCMVPEMLGEYSEPSAC